MRYDKLVRDKIPDIIAEKGSTAETHIAEEAEYLEKLRAKLQEEVGEFLESNTAEELADILEVVYALGVSLGVTRDELERLRAEKAASRGGFEKRIILEEAS
ncbi:MAG: nucleoside triphosphate pyrophosphohydrolase [Candidatus Yanofskybacteria bacterium]|nr:nucleoside triphosphate pyrophosphohydrolase [Candidatus Yanofskybacteria bacterium]